MLQSNFKREWRQERKRAVIRMFQEVTRKGHQGFYEGGKPRMLLFPVSYRLRQRYDDLEKEVKRDGK